MMECTEVGTADPFCETAATASKGGDVSQTKAGGADVSPDRTSTPMTTTEMKTPTNAATPFHLIEDLLRVKKKRRPSGVIVAVEDDEDLPDGAESTQPIKRKCRRRATSDGLQEREAALVRAMDRTHVGKGTGGSASETLLRSRTVRPSGASLGAVPLLDVVASGGVGDVAGFSGSTADDRETFNPPARGTPGFHRLEPARYLKALDAACARYGCPMCGVAYSWMHVNNHWMQNHGQFANSGQRPVFTEPRNFPLANPILFGHPPVPQLVPAHVASHSNIQARESPKISDTQNLARGPLNASLEIRKPAWNSTNTGDGITENTAKRNFPERRASGAHMSSASSGALDLTQPCLASDPLDRILDLSASIQMAPLDLSVQKTGAELSTVADVGSIAEDPKDSTIDMVAASFEKDCSQRTPAESEVVDNTSLTSEMCLSRASNLTDLRSHERQEHSKEEDLAQGQSLDSRSGGETSSSKDLTPGQSTELIATVIYSPEELEQDAASHDKGRPYSCSVCKVTYKLKWHLEKHLKKFHRAIWRLQRQAKLSTSSGQSVSFESTNSTHPAVSQPGLNLHVQGHAKETPSGCPCGYASKWKWNLVKHMKKCASVVTSTRDVCITQCPARNVDNTSSISSNKPVPLTGTVIAAVSSLLAENLSLSSDSHSSETQSFASSERRAVVAKELKCEWCDMTFTQVTSLYRHAQNLHALQLRKQEMEEALNIIPFTALPKDGTCASSCQQQMQQAEVHHQGKLFSGLKSAGLRENKDAAGQLSLKQQAVNSSINRSSLHFETSTTAPPPLLLSRQPDKFPALTASSVDSRPTRRHRRLRGRGWSIVDGEFIMGLRLACQSTGAVTSPKYKCVSCDFGTSDRCAMFQHSCSGLGITGKTVHPEETIKAVVTFPAGHPEETFVAGKTAHLADIDIGKTGFPEQIADNSKITGQGVTTAKSAPLQEPSSTDMTT